MSRKLALLVETNQYQAPTLAQLVMPKAQVADLADVLQSPAIGGFEEVITLVNASSATVRREMESFFANKKPDDLLLLYFSGHAVWAERGRVYLAVRDTRPNRLKATAIPATFIVEGLDLSGARRQVLLLDCYYSGIVTPGTKGAPGVRVDTVSAFAGTGERRVVLTATDSLHYTWKDDQVIGEAENSVFTHYVIQGLRTGEADRDADGRITLDELYDYVHEQAINNTARQTPRKSVYKDGGEIIIAQNPRSAERQANAEEALVSPTPADFVPVNSAAPAQRPLIRKGLSRRRFLQLGALVGCSLMAASAAGAVGVVGLLNLAPAHKPTPTPQPQPTRPPAKGHVVMMYRRGELTEDQVAQFEAANPGITLEVLEDDFNRFFAMYAAGNPPDLLRVQVPLIPQFLARKILYDLTPYFEASPLLQPTDLAPVNNYYQANDPLHIGEGKRYGMVKDWSPDFSLWIYKPAFEAAGVEAPGDQKSLTYAELAELATKVATFDGDRIITWGYGYSDVWSDRIWMNMLAEQKQSLYTDDYTQINLTTNAEAKKIIQWYFDLAQNNLVASPINPSPSWNGEDFVKGTVALLWMLSENVTP